MGGARFAAFRQIRIVRWYGCVKQILRFPPLSGTLLRGHPIIRGRR